MTAEDFEAMASSALGPLLVIPNGNAYARRARMMKALKAGGVVAAFDAAVMLAWVSSWVTRPIGIQTIAYKSGEWLAMANAQDAATKRRAEVAPSAPVWGSGVDDE